MSSKNKFSSALRHLNSNLDEKVRKLEEQPTNNTGTLYTLVPPNPDASPNVFTPEYQTTTTEPLNLDIGDDPTNATEAQDTSGLFDAEGLPMTATPPGDNSYILGPMASMYYGWALKTQIGYIRQEDRRMVNLGSISGSLEGWNGSEGTFTSYGQLTLEQAVWFRDIGKRNGGANNDANYRAFYPGPPSGTPDAWGRYNCVITGEPRVTTTDHPQSNSGSAQGPGDASDNFSAIMDKINKGKKLTEAEKQWLRDNGLGDFADDFADGGDTASPIGDLIGLGLSFAAAKALVAAFGALGPVVGNAMKNAFKSDWGNRTLSDAAYQRFLNTGQMPPGIQGWRPFKAFTTKMLQTGPTVEASAALTTLILQFLGGSQKNNSQSKQSNAGTNTNTGIDGFNTQSSSQGTIVNWGGNAGSAVIVAGNYGALQNWEKSILQNGLKVRSGSSYDNELKRLKKMYPGFVPQAKSIPINNTQVAHYEPRGLNLSESKSRIMKTLKEPVVLPEGKKKSYKVRPGRRGKTKTDFKGMDKLIGDTKIEKTFKEPQDIWNKDWHGYNQRKSQGKKNIVLELVGQSTDAYNYMLTDSKKMNAKQMEEFWGLHPEMYSQFHNGKKYKTIRKEELKGDRLVFLVDEKGVKTSILQSKLNDQLAQKHDQELLDEYNKLNPPKEEPVKKRPLLKKVADRLNPDLAPVHPKDPPPKMVNGMHPKFGKNYKYDKLDPVSAVMMSKAPTGDPEIDANVKKAAKKPK